MHILYIWDEEKCDRKANGQSIKHIHWRKASENGSILIGGWEEQARPNYNKNVSCLTFVENCVHFWVVCSALHKSTRKFLYFDERISKCTRRLPPLPFVIRDTASINFSMVLVVPLMFYAWKQRWRHDGGGGADSMPLCTLMLLCKIPNLTRFLEANFNFAKIQFSNMYEIQ